MGVRPSPGLRDAGQQAAKRQGGDGRSERIEIYRSVILGAVEKKIDVALSEIVELPRREHGASVTPSTVWRFPERHAMSAQVGLELQRRCASRPRVSPVSFAIGSMDNRHGRSRNC